MPISGLIDEKRKPKPLETIRIGVKISKVCRDAATYADSLHGSRCISPAFGECKHFKTCSAAGKTTDELDALYAKNKKDNRQSPDWTITRPIALPFFVMSDELRLKLNLTPRPTRIPNVIFVSDKVRPLKDSQGRVVSFEEPRECIEYYPVTESGLIWFTATEIVCQGDGKTAHWFPRSPENAEHNKCRECLYDGRNNAAGEKCPDFDGKFKCKENGELYFYILDAPGFPSMYRISTRSAPAIENAITGLYGIYDMRASMNRNAGLSENGHISFVPLSLVLKQDIARPNIGGARIKTKVHRVYIESQYTLANMLESQSAINKLVSGGVETALLNAAPPAPPAPEIPIECTVTAPPEQWNNDDAIDTTARPVSGSGAPTQGQPGRPSDPHVPATTERKKRKPSQQAAQPTAQNGQAQPNANQNAQTAAKPAGADNAPLGGWEKQEHVAAEVLIKDSAAAGTMDDLKAAWGKYKFAVGDAPSLKQLYTDCCGLIKKRKAELAASAEQSPAKNQPSTPPAPPQLTPTQAELLTLMNDNGLEMKHVIGEINRQVVGMHEVTDAEAAKCLTTWRRELENV